MKLFLKGERCYTEKCGIEKRNFAPGQHGKARKSKMLGYGVQLREKQKAVKEGYEGGLAQAHMFKDLRTILQCKLRVLRAEAGPDGGGGGGGNVMIMD